MNIISSQTPPFLFRILEAIAKLRSKFSLRIAVGYQDESGFHYGVKSTGTKMSWPPVE